jgi:RNA polymerase sigma-70 factor (ECF subfamily)
MWSGPLDSGRWTTLRERCNRGRRSGVSRVVNKPQGNEVAVDDFTDFYSAQFRSVTVQVYAYTGDLPLAQDIAQEAFTRAVMRWEKLRSYYDPAAWVRRVAFNLAASRWRRSRIAAAYLRRQRAEHIEGPSPDRVALARALATLPERHRRVVILYYLADLSIADVAQQENVPVNTVKSWLHRARTELAAQLGDLKEVSRD